MKLNVQKKTKTNMIITTQRVLMSTRILEQYHEGLHGDYTFSFHYFAIFCIISITERKDSYTWEVTIQTLQFTLCTTNCKYINFLNHIKESRRKLK